MSLTVRAPLLDDLHRQLQGHTAAEAWIDGGALYVAIRFCLLARDGRHNQRHGVEAEHLFHDLVVAYTRQDAYTSVQRGRLMYHVPGLVKAACGGSCGPLQTGSRPHVVFWFRHYDKAISGRSVVHTAEYGNR